MDESQFYALTAAAWKQIADLFEAVDPDLAEVTTAGDVVTVAFAKGVRCIINTQRPTRQIWLAARDTAIHFSYDEKTGRWVDDRGRGIELIDYVKRITKEFVGVDI